MGRSRRRKCRRSRRRTRVRRHQAGGAAPIDEEVAPKPPTRPSTGVAEEVAPKPPTRPGAVQDPSRAGAQVVTEKQLEAKLANIDDKRKKWGRSSLSDDSEGLISGAAQNALDIIRAELLESRKNIAVWKARAQAAEAMVAELEQTVV